MPTANSKARRTSPVAKGAELTPHQRRRKIWLFNSGKNQLDVAREIEKADGKSCTRQAVEGVMMDRWPPSARIVEGFCKAVGYPGNPKRLFPDYVKPKAEK